MKTPEAISKKRQDLSLRLHEIRRKTGRSPEETSFLRAEAKTLQRALGVLRRGTSAQRRAGW